MGGRGLGTPTWSSRRGHLGTFRPPGSYSRSPNFYHDEACECGATMGNIRFPQTMPIDDAQMGEVLLCTNPFGVS